MDYDDSDFHSQNFHLAGEGSSKFPPVLRPYAIPKFDFDDSHLRFDSLVETEVFLGIESNQDNNWIEDFSRGSSGIEFNSSAAETCSISRCNNVWSEATSSESVEMLLKSVGQEEIIAAPPIIEESDACDELGCLTKQMEHSLKQDSSVLSRTEDVTNLESALPPDETAGNSSGLKGDIGVDQPRVEDASQEQGGESFVHGGLHDRDPNVDSEKVDLHVSEGDIFVNIKGDDASKMDVDEHLDVQKQEDSFASRLRADNLVTSVQNTVTSSTELNNDVQPQINVVQDKNPEVHVLSKEAKMDSQNVDGNMIDGSHHYESPLHSASLVETVAEINVMEAERGNVEEPPSEIQKGHSELPTVAGHSKDECSGVPVEASKREDMVLCKGKDIGGDRPKDNMLDMPPEACKSEAQSERPAVAASNISSEIPSSLEAKMDYVEISGKEDVVESGQQLNSEILVRNSETSLSSIEITKISEGEGLESSKSHVGDISASNVTLCSAELSSETNVTGALKGVQDALGSSRENLSAESHVPTSIQTESTQICKQDDVSVSEKNTKLSGDLSDIDGDFPHKGVGSSFDESTESELNISTVGVTSAGNESVSDAALPNSNSASYESVEVSLPSENGAKMGVDHRDIQISTVSVVGSTPLEEKEDATTKILADSIVSSSIVSSQVLAASKAEEGTRCDTTIELLGKTVDQSVQTANEVSEERTKEVNVSPVLHECTVRGVDATEAVAFPESQKKAIVEYVLKDVADTSEPTTNKNGILTHAEPVPLVESLDRTHQKVEEGPKATLVSEDKSSRETSEPDAKNNGASSAYHSIPTPSSPKLSHGVHGLEEGVKGSAIQNSSVSKVIDGDSGKVASSTRGPRKRSDATKGGKIANFNVSSPAESSKRDAGKNLPAFPASPAARIAEGSPSISLVGQRDPKNAQDISQATPQVSDVEIPRGRPKGTPERKSRRSAVKATGKDNAKKGSNLKEITPAKQVERGEKPSNVAPSGMFHVMQSNEMQHYGNVEGNTNNKPFFLVAAPTSSLPDLNTSASPSTIFQQLFTDLQQVQLRAQIFVYGALIQGTVPEEAYMLSAFGESDDGRGMWGSAWQASVERLQSQKSNVINPETPLQPRHTPAGARNIDQVSKQSASQTQSKGLSTPVGRSSTKGSQTIVSAMIPLSSPLWSIPTPVGDGMQSAVMPRSSVMDYQQALTPPVHPFQTPPIRNLLGHNASWMSQATFRGPWVASPQPSLPEASARFTAFPNTERVQLIPVKETTVPHSSGTKHVSSSPMIQTGAPASVFTTAAPVFDLKKVTSSPGQHSSDSKPRKRKKNQVSEEIGPVILQSQSKPEAGLAPAISSSLPPLVAITNPTSFVSQGISEKLLSSVLPAPSFDALRKAEHDVVQKAILPEDTLGKIKEASKQAEDAAALAAAAVGHSHELWNQLEQRKNSGLVPDVEAKLASAATAVAAAAAVAKAAAAAANVAANAALQAKMMADEAFLSNSFQNPSQSNIISFSERVNVLGKATPASILRGEDGANSSSSILTAAREAARRNVEAASAASRRAENMDAIVKAAELAAEAVSQAGKIVAMGDVLPLNELIEAGPQGYWRAPQLSFERAAKSTEITRDKSKVGGVDGANFSADNSKNGRSGNKETQTTVTEKSSISREVAKESIVEHLRVDGIAGSVVTSEKEARGPKGRKVSDLTKNIVVVLEPGTITESSSINVENEVEMTGQAPKENIIKEGSKVEVFKDGDGFKAAWYTANVLSLDDGRACVSYTEIGQDEGLAQLKEWVAIAGEGADRPKIRIARPVTAMRYEGTRKRRRAAMGDYNWSVGDRVDAWMTNSWWEGVVAEKNNKDETSVTVNFPAQGETSLVKAWHLRPSLIWKDGEWVEWSNLRNDSSSHEGNIPQEKRLRLGSPAIETKGKDETGKSTDNLDAGKLGQSRLLDFAVNEKTFNIGKSTRNVNKPDATRTVRTGLQKQGSGVIFGVPKPGKKRKFVEVSKYNAADQSNKNNDANDSLKYLKYMTPQGPGSRGLKNEPKEKRVAESKLKGLKSGKQPSLSGRTVLQGENLSTDAISTSGDSTIGDHAGKVKDSFSHVDNLSGKQNVVETVSFSGSVGATETPFVFSSLAPTLDGPSKKISSSTAKSERANKGKLAPAGGKLGKIEENKVFNGNTAKSTSDAVEPRRSNRRIQPTSRLLEGLQSSLIIPKFPSVSHDKGHRGQNKNTSRGNNHG